MLDKCTHIVQLSKGPYNIFHTFLLKMQDLLGHFLPFSKDQQHRNLPIQCKKIWIKARLIEYTNKALVAVNFCLSGNYKRFFTFMMAYLFFDFDLIDTVLEHATF